MKIAAIRAYVLAARFADLYGGESKVPKSLRYPGASFVSSPRQGQFSTIVEIEAENGQLGYGECWGIPAPQICRLIIEEYLSPMVLGWDHQDIEAIWDRLFTQVARLGYTRGFMMEAISGIDIALWDLRGRIENVSIARLISDAPSDRVPCYASPVPFFDDPKESAQMARSFLDQGYLAVKIKAGRDVERDTDHIAAARDAVGRETKLLVDVNCGYDADTSIELACRMRPHDIYWLEEPIPPENLEALERVKSSIGLPLALGENEFTPNSFYEIASRGLADVINPNITRCGGITGLLKINAIAESFGLRIGLHGVGSAVMLSAALQVMSVFENADLLEHNRLLNPLRDELLEEPIRLIDGALLRPDGPGWGGRLDEGALRKYAER